MEVQVHAGCDVEEEMAEIVIAGEDEDAMGEDVVAEGEGCTVENLYIDGEAQGGLQFRCNAHRIVVGAVRVIASQQKRQVHIPEGSAAGKAAVEIGQHHLGVLG